MAFCSLFAQEKPAGITYGIKAGFTFPKLYGISQFMSTNRSYSIDEQSITSFYVGGVVNIPVGKTSSGQLFIQPGLSFVGKGGQEVTTFTDAAIAAGAALGTDLSGDVTLKETISYLEVPVNLIVDFKVGAGSLLFGVGPYLGFALSGKQNVSYSGTFEQHIGAAGVAAGTTDLVFGSGKGNDFKKIDFGLNFLFGYQLMSGLSINLGLGVSAISIHPVNNTRGEAKIENLVYSAGLGYAF